MRAFIALPVTQELKTGVEEYIRPLAERYPISWVKPANMHVTLHFFSEVDERIIPRITDVIEEVVVGSGVFPVRFKGIGRFPIRGRPRVLFLPMVHGKEECEVLYEALKNRLRGILSVDDRPFNPHLTIARVKPNHRIPYITEGPELGFTADRIVLYESILRPEGAQYRPITAVDLDGTGGGSIEQ